jgi:hypothetical protein
MSERHLHAPENETGNITTMHCICR